MSKKTIAVIFGGTNTEHEVSLVSARSVMKHMDQDKYQAIPVFITKSNQWMIEDQVITPTDLSNHHVDVVFPILHGPYGEDGAIQGLFEMLHLPYVGCGILASALCMDKVVQKQLCLQQGIPVVPFVWTTKYDWTTDPTPTRQFIANKLHYPLFVKPANQGSSIGISKVHTEAELLPAIQHAFQFDSKVIIEQGITGPREIECAVLGNDNPQVSVLGEIYASNEFYDYDAKYVDGKSKASIPTNLPTAISEKVQSIAKKAFKILNCSGLARIDFLVDGQNFDIYLNEINTMPGFTSISMYPKLWEASGIGYEQLLDQLITLGLERWQAQSQRKLSLDIQNDWYQQ